MSFASLIITFTFVFVVLILLQALIKLPAMKAHQNINQKKDTASHQKILNRIKSQREKGPAIRKRF